jgi:hypothetical protein
LLLRLKLIVVSAHSSEFGPISRVKLWARAAS